MKTSVMVTDTITSVILILRHKGMWNCLCLLCRYLEGLEELASLRFGNLGGVDKKLSKRPDEIQTGNFFSLANIQNLVIELVPRCHE